MKQKFPILTNHPELVYLDSAATALKPAAVTEAEARYAHEFGTNAARGLYPLAEATNTHIEAVRAALADFLHTSPAEIIFTSGTTAGMNMLSQSIAATPSLITPTGNIVITEDAHHSAALPFLQLAARNSWDTRLVPLKETGHIDEAVLAAAVTPDTKILVLTLVSNVFGVMQNLAPTIAAAKKINPAIFVVVDAAQAVAHTPIDVTTLGADALVFSGHKMYGPTGVGVCFLRSTWQERLTPGNVGGGMVLDTAPASPEWKTGPEKFEAGTLPLAQIFGLSAALEFLLEYGFANMQAHEQHLVTYATEKLQTTFGRHLHILGSLNPREKIGLLSFTIEGVHPHDIASLLGNENICVRAGEHCASFLHRSLGITATTRISFGVYTTEEDIDTAIAALAQAVTLFQSPIK